MVIGAFQQNRISEPIPQPQVNADRCENICQHPFTKSVYFNLLHSNKLKAPNIVGAGYIFSNTVTTLQPLTSCMPPPYFVYYLYHYGTNIDAKS